MEFSLSLFIAHHLPRSQNWIKGNCYNNKTVFIHCIVQLHLLSLIGKLCTGTEHRMKIMIISISSIMQDYELGFPAPIFCNIRLFRRNVNWSSINMIRETTLTVYFLLFSFCFIVKHVLDNYYLPEISCRGKKSNVQPEC